MVHDGIDERLEHDGWLSIHAQKSESS
jgi:hypothetical protein